LHREGDFTHLVFPLRVLDGKIFVDGILPFFSRVRWVSIPIALAEKESSLLEGVHDMRWSARPPHDLELSPNLGDGLIGQAAATLG
jgi:hypothetical protein